MISVRGFNKKGTDMIIWSLVLIVVLIVLVSAVVLLLNPGESVNIEDETIFDNSDSCLDSDSGVFSLTRGIIEYSGKQYADSCSGNTLKELYCDNGKLKTVEIICDIKCLNGACTSSSSSTGGTTGTGTTGGSGTIGTGGGNTNNTNIVVTTGCTSSCGPSGSKICFNLTSTVTCGNYDTDSCLEFSSIEFCGTGETCSNGICTSNVSTCNDSDNGFNIFVKAQTISKIGELKVDECYNSTAVNEWVCLDDGLVSTSKRNCPYGYVCSNGACKINDYAGDCSSDSQCSIGRCINGYCVGSPRSSCNDSDNGDNLFSKGLVIDKYGTLHTDRCYNSSHVNEWVCLDDSSSYPYLRICPNNYECVSGKCAVQPSSCNQCSSLGIKMCEGIGYKTCQDANGDGCFEWSNVTACEIGRECQNGNCVASSSVCHDDDNGANIYVRGNVVDKFGTFHVDDCYNITSVNEWVCLDDERSWPAIKNCPPGYVCSSGGCVIQGFAPDCISDAQCSIGRCINGYCVGSPRSSCNDSDNGDNFFTKGLVIDKYGTLHSDRCYNSTHVNEWVCWSSYDNSSYPLIANCPVNYNCNDGRCNVVSSGLTGQVIIDDGKEIIENMGIIKWIIKYLGGENEN